MILDKLSDWPSPKITRLLLLISIIILVIVYPFMGYYFFVSNYSINIFESQLSFNAALLRTAYTAMNADQLFFYRAAETLDYGFMVSYSMLIISLALIIARKFDESSIWRKSGYCIVLLGIVAACLDAIENGFILSMTANPLSFPDIWAIAHSSFALIKWILLFIAIGWAITACIIRLVKK